LNIDQVFLMAAKSLFLLVAIRGCRALEFGVITVSVVASLVALALRVCSFHAGLAIANDVLQSLADEFAFDKCAARVTELLNFLEWPCVVVSWHNLALHTDKHRVARRLGTTPRPIHLFIFLVF
jgi:hypothetical protein